MSSSPVDENAIPWKEDFWNTTAVVLEANEEAMDGRHLPAFLMADIGGASAEDASRTGRG